MPNVAPAYKCTRYTPLQILAKTQLAIFLAGFSEYLHDLLGMERVERVGRGKNSYDLKNRIAQFYECFISARFFHRMGECNGVTPMDVLPVTPVSHACSVV